MVAEATVPLVARAASGTKNKSIKYYRFYIIYYFYENKNHLRSFAAHFCKYNKRLRCICPDPRKCSCNVGGQ